MSVRNRKMALQGYVGSAIASAASIALGASVGNLIEITGSTAIAAATVLANLASAGRCVTLRFSTAGCQVLQGATLDLRGSFVSRVGSTLTLVCDGTVWREVCRGKDGWLTKALTESNATGFVDISVASNKSVSGVIEYEIYADDATDFQVRTGVLQFSAVNKGGTVTTAISTPSSATESASLSSGTLANTSTATAGTLKTTLNANAVSSLTQTTLEIRYKVRLFEGDSTITPL